MLKCNIKNLAQNIFSLLIIWFWYQETIKTMFIIIIVLLRSLLYTRLEPCLNKSHLFPLKLKVLTSWKSTVHQSSFIMISLSYFLLFSTLNFKAMKYIRKLTLLFFRGKLYNYLKNKCFLWEIKVNTSFHRNSNCFLGQIILKKKNNNV